MNPPHKPTLNEALEVDFTVLITKTIAGMREVADEIGLK